MAGGSFFQELRRRKVLQAAAIYGAVAWGVTEIVVTVVEQLFLPQWVATLAVIFFVVGFPVAMFLSWTFDITAGGIRRTEVSSRRGQASIALSLLLLFAGTAGLFVLIKPALQDRDRAAAPPAAAPNSLAVLPFENVSRREDDFYLSEGLGDELRDQLARVKGFQIAARSSSIAARNQAMGAVQMAATLGVAYLVEGSLRRNGSRLSISVQLIDGASGLAVWSAHFERGRLEILDVQQQIAREVVAAVFPDAPGLDAASPATLDASANDLMLLARHKENQVRSRQVVDTSTLLEATRLYREATRADPGSALAHSRLAGALLYLGDIEAAEVAITTALSLNAELSEVQNTLGELYWVRGDPLAADAFRKAVELNPHNADALHNYAHVRLLRVAEQGGDGDSPAQLLRRALAVDPLSLQRHSALGEVLGLYGDWAAIPEVIARVNALFDDAESRRVVAWLHELLGELDQAVAWTLKARELEPGNVDHNAKLAELFALMGDADTALALEPDPGIGTLFQLRRYGDLIDKAEFRIIDEPNDMEARSLLAFAYVTRDQFEQAIRILGPAGLTEIFLNDMFRSTAEIEAFYTLANALAGSGIPEAVEAARSLLSKETHGPWWGEIGWLALFKSCNLAILGERERVIELLPRIKESRRLRRPAYLHDSWCFGGYQDEPAYQDVLADQERRRARLRAQLPATLAKAGVRL